MVGNYNYTNFREWMYRRIDEETSNISAEFAAGVDEFMNFAGNQPLALSNRGKFCCPCNSCKNNKIMPGNKIANHIFTRGFMPHYYVWYMHGEDLNVDLGSCSASFGRSQNEEVVSHVEDTYVGMVNDAFPAQHNMSYDENNNDQAEHGNDYQNIPEVPNIEAQNFYTMLEAANKPLYDGCEEGHSQLSLASRLLHMKTNYNESERELDEWAELISEYLPKDNHCTTSYYETEKLM
jgi:hypothetical protein